MDGKCMQCCMLKQASDDAVRVETVLLAQKFLAADNGDTMRLAKLEPHLLQASDLRRQARRAFSAHQDEHLNGPGSLLTPEKDSARIMSLRAAGSN
jgi:hypothetical protein